MQDTERIKRSVKVRQIAGKLLENANEPVDAWELSQELGYTEQQVEQAIHDLEREGYVEVEGGKIVATHPMSDREAAAHIRETVKAYRQDIDHTPLMDIAARDFSDKQWEELEEKLKEADRLPPLPLSKRQKKEQADEELRQAQVALANAQRHLQELQSPRKAKR